MRVLKCGVTIETHYGPWSGGCLASCPETQMEWERAIHQFACKVADAVDEMPKDSILSTTITMQPGVCNGVDFQTWAEAATDVHGMLWGDLDLIFTPLIAEKGKVKRGKRA